MFDGKETTWRGKGNWKDVEIVERKNEADKEEGENTLVEESGDIETNSGQTEDSQVGGAGLTGPPGE